MAAPQSGGSPPETLSDEEIIGLVLDGDTERFSELVRRHGRRVYRVGISWFKDHDEAEDLVQEVFVKAYTKLSTFRFGSKFSTWLLRIAYNTATSTRSRRRLHEEIDDESIADRRSAVEEGLIEKEKAREVREALAFLSPEQAICVELCFFQDLSYIEIAKITGFPVNTIKSHVFRAKRMLRERLSMGA
ncbi:MAG TPA: sigma-70 family RNA polymerase sigma factor [Rectinemataceae bacterium]|nr:sigma-70 family RNA polymerase sigma factor [Rectinemataceae bacterium]